jgi:c-di-GMP-binding flagellar brake protein YcgR
MPAPIQLTDDGPERRQTERRPLRTSAVVLLPGDQTFTVQTLDISLGGMGIVANANPRQGTRFSIRVALPVRPTGQYLFEAGVEVAHSILARDEGAFKVGLRFVSLDPRGESAIRHFIASR